MEPVFSKKTTKVVPQPSCGHLSPSAWIATATHARKRMRTTAFDDCQRMMTIAGAPATTPPQHTRTTQSARTPHTQQRQHNAHTTQHTQQTHNTQTQHTADAPTRQTDTPHTTQTEHNTRSTQHDRQNTAQTQNATTDTHTTKGGRSDQRGGEHPPTPRPHPAKKPHQLSSIRNHAENAFYMTKSCGYNQEQMPRAENDQSTRPKAYTSNPTSVVDAPTGI